MLEVINWFVIALITYFLDCYVFCKFIDKKFKFSKRLLLLIICFSLLNGFVMLINNNNIIKFLLTNLIIYIILKSIYKKSSSNTLIGTMFIYLGYVVAEFIFLVTFIILFGFDPNYFVDNYFGSILVNVFDFIIFLIIFRIKIIIKFISNVMKWYEENKIFNLIIRIIVAIVLCYLVIYFIVHNKINTDVKLLILSIVFSIILFVAGYFKEKSGNNKLTIEYVQLLDYVKTYEDEVVDKSKTQHEYKNQLVIIDDMIPKTNKKAKEYLKKVLNSVEDVTDNDWLVKLKNLPSGGIKGLVHFKIKKMIENKISVFVDVDKKLSKKDNWINVEKNLEDISRILGVYLDNAIEAASKTKDKQIVMEFVNRKENIEFVLSNSYSGNINFNELDKEGYSTKGKGRGVGLSLVRDIIKSNKLLNQSRELNGKFYVQKLYIKK